MPPTIEKQNDKGQSLQELLWTTLTREQWPLVVLLLAWLVLCFDLLTGQSVVAFRDSGNLYYPLFQAIDHAWQSGQVPLFNPYCDFGYPLVADGTSSVFYPGKLIFLFRFLSYPARYGIYQSLHLLVAALNAYALARQFRCDRAGGTMAAMSYAFGAPVLFQVTNVVFLVSAAWLPLAILAIWRMVIHGSIRWTLVAAVTCALMILGGDPQMTYHVGLIALLSISSIALVNACRAFGSKSGSQRAQTAQWSFSRFSCLVMLVIVTTLLSAIQILPTAKLATQSERIAKRESPPAFFSDQETTVGQYQFSQPPWTMLELGVPNLSGRPFPIHTRWMARSPSSDRMWYPSLYLGFLTLTLAVTQFRLTGRRRRRVWLSWIVLGFLLGSWGWYGGIWLINELRILFGFESLLPGNPVGGVYWWMSKLLPLYGSFRYPAKLIIVATLGISILGGLGCRRLASWNPTWLWRIAVAILFLTPVTIEGFLRPHWRGLAKADRYAQEILDFGPFNPELACQHAYVSGFQLALFCAAIAAVLTCFGRLPKANRLDKAHWTRVALTVIFAADLILANSWMMAKVSSTAFEAPVSLGPSVQPIYLGSSPTPFAVTSQASLPASFLTSASPDRLEELILWDRATLRAKHHLTTKTRLLGSFHSIQPSNYFSEEFAGLITNEMNDYITTADIRWNQATFELTVPPTQAESLTLPLYSDGSWRGQAVEMETQQVIELNSISLPCDEHLPVLSLPPGKWRVELTYQPFEFYMGFWLSLASWLLWLVWAIGAVMNRVRQSTSRAFVEAN